jgi:O-antigen/teichoic acid export membrane protein
LVLLQTPYIGAIMAKQRMNVYAYVSVYDVIVKLLIVLILPHIPYDSLQTFAILTLLINISNLLIYYLYCKRKFSEISFEMRFDRPLFKNILGFTGWNVIGTFAFMLKGQGVNMLLNSFFGPIINAARGIAYQVNTAISGFSQNITIAFRPQIVNSYAEGNFSRVTSLIFTESKICFMLIATLIIPVIVELNYILQLWLGTNVPDMTYGFTILVLIDTLICTLNTPCTQVIQATGKLKSYQIASTIVNILLIPLCWIFLQMGFNPYVVFILTIIISILNQLVCLIEVRKVFALKLKEYFYDVILSCLIFVIAISILPYSLKYLMASSFGRFIFVVLTTILIAIPVAYRIGLTPSQREGVRIFIKSKFKKNV